MSGWLDDKMSELGRVSCESCDTYYKSLGHHWKENSDCAPELSDEQIEIITGLLMGDGWLNTHGCTPYVATSMISPNYLEFLDDNFGKMGAGVKLRKTAKESANNSRKSGFHEDALEENYSDIYEWRTLRNPHLSSFTHWYDCEKCWPRDIELTPTVLKHWYVCDGSISSNNHIKITADNESENVDKLVQYFSNIDLPEPTTTVYDRPEDAWSDSQCLDLTWSIDDSKILLDYMGDPLPDFDYKWSKSS